MTTRELHRLHRVAVAQMRSSNDMERNFAAVACLTKKAATQGAEIVFFPECFHFMGARAIEAVEMADSLDGKIISRYKNLAKEEGMWLSLGGFQERPTNENAENSKYYNTHLIIDEKGSLVSSYRKIHLFDVEDMGLMESKHVLPGNKVVVCDSPFGKIGLSICFDLRFPSLYSTLCSRGAEILTVPSAFTLTTGMEHWHVLLRARAIETQSYVIASGQEGKHNERRESYGHSVVIDPMGRIIAQCSEGEEVAVAVVDLNFLQKVRKRMPLKPQPYQ